MKKTYTEHGLTDQMLRRLSQLANGRPHKHGNSLTALEVRGLAVEKSREGWAGIGPNRHEYQNSHEITPAGRDALDKARREGW